MADTYQVTGQRQTTLIGDNGQLQQVIEVSYTLPTIGFKGHVDIPVARFSTETVKAAIEAAAKVHTEVHGL